MSKAFTKEDDGQVEAPPAIPQRATLPAGTTNYVTPRGLEALRAEVDALVLERNRVDATLAASDGQPQRRALEILDARRHDVESRIASAVVVTPQATHPGVVRLGARVRVRLASGTARVYEIVGVDEADASAGRVAFVAPVARALLGRRVGDTATVRIPRGQGQGQGQGDRDGDAEEQMEILDIAYDSGIVKDPTAGSSAG